MKIKLTLVLLLFFSLGKAQETNKNILDTLEKKTIMINVCTKDSLLKFEEFKKGYESNYPFYTPNKKIIPSLKQLTENKKITIVLGTWCGDSRQFVPFFFKVLDEAKIGMENITLICVDRDKKAENRLVENLNIKSVPTFIFYDHKNHELGRIVEYPKDTLEADMQKILTKD